MLQQSEGEFHQNRDFSQPQKEIVYQFLAQEQNQVPASFKLILFEEMHGTVLRELHENIKPNYEAGRYEHFEFCPKMKARIETFQVIPIKASSRAEKLATQQWLSIWQIEVQQLTNFESLEIIVEVTNGPAQVRQMMQDFVFICGYGVPTSLYVSQLKILQFIKRQVLRETRSTTLVTSEYPNPFVQSLERFRNSSFKFFPTYFNIETHEFYTEVQVTQYLVSEKENRQAEYIQTALEKAVSRSKFRRRIGIKRFLSESNYFGRILARQFHLPMNTLKLLEGNKAIMVRGPRAATIEQKIRRLMSSDSISDFEIKLNSKTAWALTQSQTESEQNFDQMAYLFSKFCRDEFIIFPHIFSKTGIKCLVLSCDRQYPDQMVQKLRLYFEKFDHFAVSEDQLDCFLISLDSLREQMVLLAYKEQKRVNLFGPGQQLELIKQKINQYGQKVVIKQQAFATAIFHDLKRGALTIPEVESYNLDDKLYLVSEKKHMQNVTKALANYEKTIQLVEIPIEISKIEAKYLKKFHSQDIQGCRQKYLCEIIFQVEKSAPPRLINQPLMHFKDKAIIVTTRKVVDVILVNPQESRTQGIQSNYELKCISFDRKNYQFAFLVYKPLFRQKVVSVGVNYCEVKETLIDLIDSFMNQVYFRELHLFIDQESQKDEVEQVVFSQMNQKLSQNNKIQWQWEDYHSYVDYDDDYMNQQIEQGYQQFLKNEALNKINLRFPCSYEPGTHTVDLAKMIIKDNASFHHQQLSVKDGIYFIDNEQVDDSINQFIFLNQSQGKQTFQIFLKSYTVYFESEQSIQQINQQSNYRRRMRRIMKEPIQSQTLMNWIKKKNDSLATSQPGLCLIKASSADILPMVSQELTQLLHPMTVQVRLPRALSDASLFQMMNILSDYSVRMQGDIAPGQVIDITTFDIYEEKIRGIVRCFGLTPPESNWDALAPQEESVDARSAEYMMIAKEFPFLKIGEVIKYQHFGKYQSAIDPSREVKYYLYGDPRLQVKDVLRNGPEQDYNYGEYVPLGSDETYLAVKHRYFESDTRVRSVLICMANKEEFEKAVPNTYQLDNSRNLTDQVFYYIAPQKIYFAYLATLVN